MYGQQGMYVDPAQAGYMSPQQQQQQQQADMYAQQQGYAQGYAGDPYGQQQMGMSPSAGALSPMAGYDQGYTNYMYAMPPSQPHSPSGRRVILTHAAPRRRGFCNTDNVLTLLIVCGTLFLVALAMLLIVTVVVPRLTRKHRSNQRKGINEFPLEENFAEEEISAVDAPQQQNVQTEEEADPTSEQRTHHAVKQGAKDPALTRHVRRRKSG